MNGHEIPEGLNSDTKGLLDQRITSIFPKSLPVPRNLSHSVASGHDRCAEILDLRNCFPFY